MRHLLLGAIPRRKDLFGEGAAHHLLQKLLQRVRGAETALLHRFEGFAGHRGAAQVGGVGRADVNLVENLGQLTVMTFERSRDLGVERGGLGIRAHRGSG
tara:strand:+ start:1118 stop:1417 length:300 start_codon:yes stop_codon:yes gene_type:complete